jgi:hypothetical protein
MQVFFLETGAFKCVPFSEDNMLEKDVVDV